MRPGASPLSASKELLSGEATASDAISTVRRRTMKGLLPETLQFCKAVEFTGLTVSQVWPEDGHGVARVLFTAAYRAAGKAATAVGWL